MLFSHQLHIKNGICIAPKNVSYDIVKLHLINQYIFSNNVYKSFGQEHRLLCVNLSLSMAT